MQKVKKGSTTTREKIKQQVLIGKFLFLRNGGECRNERSLGSFDNISEFLSKNTSKTMHENISKNKIFQRISKKWWGASI